MCVYIVIYCYIVNIHCLLLCTCVCGFNQILLILAEELECYLNEFSIINVFYVLITLLVYVCGRVTHA